MDVKPAFLCGLIEGEVYVRQPTGFDNQKRGGLQVATSYVRLETVTPRVVRYFGGFS